MSEDRMTEFVRGLEPEFLATLTNATNELDRLRREYPDRNVRSLFAELQDWDSAVFATLEAKITRYLKSQG